MRNDKPHLSDEELIRVADGELGRKIKKARVHLESCAECRNKLANFDLTIAELVHAQRYHLDAELPRVAGPRALLLTRLTEIAARESSFASRFMFPARHFAGELRVAVAVGLVAFSGLLAFRHFAWPREYSPLLSSGQGILPNKGFTPGAARPVSLPEICAMTHEEVVKQVSPKQRQKIFAEYGIPSAQANEYEVDYLITPGLGGEDDIRNLWPEPYHPVAWNAHLKDILEERLHEMVCSDQIDLSVAQRAISSNWIAAYQKYVVATPSKENRGKEM
jgi:hypothetical protein